LLLIAAVTVAVIVIVAVAVAVAVVVSLLVSLSLGVTVALRVCVLCGVKAAAHAAMVSAEKSAARAEFAVFRGFGLGVSKRFLGGSSAGSDVGAGRPFALDFGVFRGRPGPGPFSFFLCDFAFGLSCFGEFCVSSTRPCFAGDEAFEGLCTCSRGAFVSCADDSVRGRFLGASPLELARDLFAEDNIEAVISFHSFSGFSARCFSSNKKCFIFCASRLPPFCNKR